MKHVADKRHHSRQEENPARTKESGIRTTARWCIWQPCFVTAGRYHLSRHMNQWHPAWRVRSISSPQRVIFGQEIYATEGEVVAWIGGGQSVREGLPAHMARFAASIWIIGAKTDDASAAHGSERHATDGDKRHQVSQTVFRLHGRIL